MKSENEDTELNPDKAQTPGNDKEKSPPRVMSENQRKLFEKMGIVIKVKKPESPSDKTTPGH